MSNAARQKSRRDRLRKEGLVGIRIDVNPELRASLKIIAAKNGSTMKEEVIVALNKHINGV